MDLISFFSRNLRVVIVKHVVPNSMSSSLEFMSSNVIDSCRFYMSSIEPGWVVTWFLFGYTAQKNV